MAILQERKVGIYVRLSNEDARVGESVSIENQKLLLTKHVRDQGWELVETYCDDGLTGTNQNRPALQKMLQDIRQHLINTVLIKDLSRLGRNYLEVGNLAEVFLPEHGCELISLTEKVDEMMVFRNWFNEQHSKDTSKKVRSVKKMCAQNGKYMGTYAPYGYRKDPNNKHRFIIDENTAPIVREIFELRVAGKGYRAIATHLNNAGIIPPRDYYYQAKNTENPLRINHCWCDATIKSILINEAYIGNMVQSKVGTVSYKNHKTVAKPQEEWVRAEGTHEAIIERKTWEQTQRIGQNQYQPRVQKDGEANIFSGLLVCTDCGFKMRLKNKRRARADGSEYHLANFVCGSYSRSGRAACTSHVIGEEVLSEIVLKQIRSHARLVELDEASVVESILRLQNSESEASRAALISEMKNHKNRLTMLDKLIEKLCEDRVTGIVPETAFRNLIQKYEQERLDRQQTAQNLENRIQSIRQNRDGASKWAGIIKSFTQLETLDAQTLLLLIDRIEIGDSILADGQRTRNVKIIYNYVGDICGVSLTTHNYSLEGTVSAYGQAI